MIFFIYFFRLYLSLLEAKKMLDFKVIYLHFRRVAPICVLERSPRERVRCHIAERVVISLAERRKEGED